MNVKEIKGRVDISSGKFSGYVLWKHSDGFHLRWKTKGKKENTFQGKILCKSKVLIKKKINPDSKDKIKKTGTKIIEWNTTLKGDVDGIDFLTPGSFDVELLIDNKKIKPKVIFLGPQMIQPESNPFTITQVTPERIIQPKETTTKTESVYKPLPEPEPEPLYEPPSEPEPVYEPIPEPEPEPMYEPPSEPESVYEATPEPEPEHKPLYENLPEPKPFQDPESTKDYEDDEEKDDLISSDDY